MTPQFTTPCYVRVDDKDKRKEICDKLEPLGYKIKVDYTEDMNPIVVASKLGILHDMKSIGDPRFIDCGTNTDLFLALAGMREDTDYMQWFVSEEMSTQGNELFDIGSKFLLAEPKFDGTIKVHKATAAELIELFKQKGE